MSGVNPANLEHLSAVFKQDELEWRLQQADKGNNGIWGRALVYVTNRAIMERFDKVCGAENWKNEFCPAPNSDDRTAVLCGISILIDRGENHLPEWVTKWDGAENSATEPVKGGLSGSMKRAAVQWGVGRYLYYVEDQFIDVVEDGRFRGKTKGANGENFNWNPPALPAWAVSSDDTDKLAENLEVIKSLGRTIPDNARAYLNKKNRVIKEFVRDNWPNILKDHVLAAEVCEAMQKASK